MDLKTYFQKLRETERSISEEYPIVISLETPEGGKAGVSRSVSRENAAKLLVDGRAVLASEEEAEVYRQDVKRRLQAIQEGEAAKRVQISIVSNPELQAQLACKKQNSPVNAK